MQKIWNDISISEELTMAENKILEAKENWEKGTLENISKREKEKI